MSSQELKEQDFHQMLTIIPAIDHDKPVYCKNRASLVARNDYEKGEVELHK